MQTPLSLPGLSLPLRGGSLHHQGLPLTPFSCTVTSRVTLRALPDSCLTIVASEALAWTLTASPPRSTTFPGFTALPQFPPRTPSASYVLVTLDPQDLPSNPTWDR